MTANEMASELELKLDRSSSFGSPGYEDFELTSVLTKAEMFYVKKFISGKNNRNQESIEETEVRGQGLSGLIKRSNSLPVSTDQTNVLKNGTYYDLPDDFMLTLSETVITDVKICGKEEFVESGVTVVKHDSISRWLNNKYKKPFCFNYGEAKTWRLYYSREVDGSDINLPATNKRHQLLTDGNFGIKDYIITYLQMPKGIVVDNVNPNNQVNSVLDPSTHLTIIDIAADLMMDRVKEQKAQSIEGIKDIE